MVFAASSVTDKERKAAQSKRVDGSKPVVVEPTPYRPKLDSTYVEPEVDTGDDGLEFLYETHGKALIHAKGKLPPRQDIIIFDESKHQKEFEELIQWGDCPQELRPRIEGIIKEYWDVFAKEGLKQPIRGFQFTIDTGGSKPVCCKLPRYGPHESRIITKMTEGLESNDLVEDDEGPYGSLVVLAQKAGQDLVHWSDYVFRLCVS